MSIKATDPHIDTVDTEELVTATGGIDCDSLRGISGKFKPEDDGERAAARACIDAGHPLIKKP